MADTLPVTKGSQPTEAGSYVVYYEDWGQPFDVNRGIFMWSDGMWWYPLSDKRLRWRVMGYIGPLPGLKTVRDEIG